jgi:integrase
LGSGSTPQTRFGSFSTAPGGRSRRETIGRVDRVPLETARETARKALAKVELGSDPQADKAEAKARAKATFGALAKSYLDQARARQKPRSFEETTRHINTHWVPLHDQPIHSINRAFVAGRLKEIARQSGPIAANRARAALSALFTWAMGTGRAEANPVLGTVKAAAETAREHVISDAELKAIWSTCRDDDHGRIIRLLILTAQRRDEVGDMTWSELDLGRALWTIPAARTKNGRAHEVPLSKVAVAILGSIPRCEGRDLVFGKGKGGFSGWSASKHRLDARIAKTGAKVRPWRLHDLRRTAATDMADLGTLPHVIEAALNHVSGHRAGVAGIYNRALYAAEKRDALERWAQHVLKHVAGARAPAGSNDG